MSKIITTRDPIIEEIVEEGRKTREARQQEADVIRKNWAMIRKQGFGYAGSGMDPAILDYEQGRFLFDVMSDGAWKDQRCFIIGGGESLKDFDFSKLKNELVIGVNRAYEKIDCTVMFAMDRTLYEWITTGALGQETKKKFGAFKGFPVWLDSAGYDYPSGIFVLGKLPNSKFNYSMKNGISGGTNSGFGALNLAACLGANPIYLLGFDMKGKNGKQAWWHNGYPEKQGDEVYKTYISDFKKAASELKEKGVQVVNLNPESELKCFDFGEFKDVEPIEHPMIVSYYTKGTGYEEQVEYLKITLKRFNLENDIVGISDKGGWHQNTYYKARFIQQMMRKYPKRSIVFVDADAKIRANPVLFNTLDCDFACHFRQGKELLSGTLYFGNTKGARLLVRKWIEENRLYPKTHMPQKNLRSVFNRYQNEIKWEALPVEYCMIFDSHARNKTRPVIEHFQLSRKYKTKETGSRHGYMMPRPLVDIQEFCEGKTICLLGNADSVLQKKKNIDSFDIVARCNRGTPKGKEGFIGSRTDILFLSTHMSGKNIQKAFSPRHVVWMTVCHRLASAWTIENAVQNPKEDWKALHKKLSINPTTGLMALNFILKHLGFKSLVIYGFDFFATKSWYNSQIDSGQKHSGAKEKVLFMKMIKERPNVRFMEK